MYKEILQLLVNHFAFEIHEMGKVGAWDRKVVASWHTWINNSEYGGWKEFPRDIMVTTPLGDTLEFKGCALFINGKHIKYYQNGHLINDSVGL